jgi:hypothetical protein
MPNLTSKVKYFVLDSVERFASFSRKYILEAVACPGRADNHSSNGTCHIGVSQSLLHHGKCCVDDSYPLTSFSLNKCRFQFLLHEILFWSPLELKEHSDGESRRNIVTSGAHI